jgi:hypothetical protein
VRYSVPAERSWPKTTGRRERDATAPRLIKSRGGFVRFGGINFEGGGFFAPPR